MGDGIAWVELYCPAELEVGSLVVLLLVEDHATGVISWREFGVQVQYMIE